MQSKLLPIPRNWAVRNHGDYNVEDMFIIAGKLKPFSIPISNIKRVLKLKVWRSKEGVSISPLEVLNDKTRQIEVSHWNSILNGNLEYPIIVMDEKLNWNHIASKEYSKASYDPDQFGKWDVLDGYHRLALAVLMNLTSILAVELSWDNLQTTKIDWSQYESGVDVRASMQLTTTEKFNSIHPSEIQNIVFIQTKKDFPGKEASKPLMPPPPPKKVIILPEGKAPRITESRNIVDKLKEVVRISIHKRPAPSDNPESRDSKIVKHN